MATTARTTRWEPSEEAEALKQEFARKKRRRGRWGDKIVTTPDAPDAPGTLVALPSSCSTPEATVTVESLQARAGEINALLKQLPTELDDERAALTAERSELVKQVVALQFGGGRFGLNPKSVRAPQFLVKLPLSDDRCPGGAGGLIGLIIGPRGKTQQRIQTETGCTILVRGKGATKQANGLIDEAAEEETHVRITGPTEEACRLATTQIETLIDFTSAEGERLREAQHRQLKVLNGTLNEEREIECAELSSSSPQRAHSGPPLLLTVVHPLRAGTAPRRATSTRSARSSSRASSRSSPRGSSMRWGSDGSSGGTPG